MVMKPPDINQTATLESLLIKFYAEKAKCFSKKKKKLIVLIIWFSEVALELFHIPQLDVIFL